VVFNALCSNDYFSLVTDGGAFGRTDKIEVLLPYPNAVSGIKVCWEGPNPGRNCGRCEKCVMTRLNFLAAGVPEPLCFDSPLELTDIARLDLPSVQASRDLFRTCLNELEVRGCRGSEVDLLRHRLRRVPPAGVVATLLSGSPIQGILPRLIRKVRSLAGAVKKP
jgi:hypothetical protein